MHAPHVAAAIIATLAPLAAQALTWTQLTPVGPPSARYEHTMVYDAARQRIVMIGGENGPSGFFQETWEWTGTAWSQALPAASPPARAGHALAYDASRQRVVLFGGSNPATLADTWEYDGVTWVAKFSLNYPGPRRDHTLTYDSARQRVVLFGGDSGTGSLYLNDTWEWDGNNWVQRSPATIPQARSRHAAVFDAARQRLVMFGGWSGTGFGLWETWEWDGTDWLPATSGPLPMGTSNHSMTFDSQGQRVVLFGGHISPFVAPTNGTWEWGGSTWTQLAMASSPSGRHGHAIAYDEARQQIVLFGGSSTGSGLNDTWVTAPWHVYASASAYGNGCGTPANLVFTPDGSGRPIIGQTGSATITNAPTPIAAVALGFSNQAYGPFSLPVTLGSIGMSGCDLWQSADVLGLGTTPLAPTSLGFALPIPNLSGLLNAHVYLQAYAFAPGANPLGLIISNGIDWQFGNS